MRVFKIKIDNINNKSDKSYLKQTKITIEQIHLKRSKNKKKIILKLKLSLYINTGIIYFILVQFY